MENLFDSLKAYYPEMVEIRRHLHQHPELSFEEVETPNFIASYHEKLGLEVRTGVGKRGVVATLKGGKPGKTVALRADFDALPIQEENDLPYNSKYPGKMHACGHDGHTATLLVLAKVLTEIKEELEGNVVFIHQHAEELAPGGAIEMINDGCLDGVDVIYGTHLWAMMPTGTIGYRSGPVMAAADRFTIKIQGKGGHGAQPHKTKDSILIGSQLIMSLQQIVSRRVNPLDSAVVSIGAFEAKNAFNVIADTALLTGTARSFKDDVRTTLEEEIDRITKGVCLAADATYEYHYYRGYPPVVNHREDTEFVANVAQGVPGVREVVEIEPEMGGEDFAYYLEKVPGTFFFTGAEDEAWDETYPHHHPKFKINEDAMLIAANVLGAATLAYLKKEAELKEEAVQ